MTTDEAVETLRAAWPEHGCGAGDCCLRRPGGQVLGTCRCVRSWKDRPGVQPVYRLLDAARLVVETPCAPPPSLDEALAVLVDRAREQAESGTGEVARPLREAVARLLPSLRIALPWHNGQRTAGDGGWACRIERDGGGYHARLAPSTGGASLYIRPGYQQAAEGWCDEQLRAAGWVLL